MGRQRAARDRDQFLRGEAAGNRERRNNEQESGNQHVDAQRQVVPGRIGIDSGEGAAVVSGAARVRVQDFGEAVGSAVIGIGSRGPRRIPVTVLGERRNGTDSRESRECTSKSPGSR